MTLPPPPDALTPAEIAEKTVATGQRKASLSTGKTLALAFLAGTYIAFGALFATTVGAGATGVLSYGLTRLLMGVAFCIGLILVILGGAELFTGNVLIAMAWASKKVSSLQLLRNWALVYLGNLAGSLVIALLIFWGRQYTFGSGAVGTLALSIAGSKTHLEPLQAFSLGILANLLVCLGVWLAYGGRTTADKVLGILFPVTAFVAAGLEHSIANMYFIPIGLFIKDFDPAFTAGVVASAGLNLDSLTWVNFFLVNLLPVTLGNIIGGAVMVGLAYWWIYIRKVQ